MQLGPMTKTNIKSALAMAISTLRGLDLLLCLKDIEFVVWKVRMLKILVKSGRPNKFGLGLQFLRRCADFSVQYQALTAYMVA